MDQEELSSDWASLKGLVSVVKPGICFLKAEYIFPNRRNFVAF